MINVARVKVGSREVNFSNPDKVFFPEPGLTKGDLVRYYLDVADCLLHHVRNRPMQMDEDVATTTWKVADRRGVFVDYGQNARDRTIACAYSIRPTPDARASAPVRWEEVTEVDPSRFTLRTMRERIAEVGDLTKGIWRRKVSLLPRFEKLGLTALTSSKR